MSRLIQIIQKMNQIRLLFIFSSLIIQCLCVSTLKAQASLNNPSFEDEPGDATVPMGWFACQKGTTPDILPGYWGVYNDASEGETFVGMITRENSTFESIGQRFSKTLEKNRCYSLALDLAHSDIYSGYSEPIGLRIWISDEKCKTTQLIHQFSPINNQDWQRFKIEFKPQLDANYVLFEAFIKEGSFSHKGNILIDNISAIFPCDKT